MERRAKLWGHCCIQPASQPASHSVSQCRQTVSSRAMAVSQCCCCRVAQCHTLSLSPSVLFSQCSLSLSTPQHPFRFYGGPSNSLHPLVPSSNSPLLFFSTLLHFSIFMCFCFLSHHPTPFVSPTSPPFFHISPALLLISLDLLSSCLLKIFFSSCYSVFVIFS